MKKISVASTLALVLAAAVASASGVGPGSPAPALDVKAWYKGTPVTSFDKNQLYVVEFWATWCGPCKESIPHLTELAKSNPDVKFIGVSIWEDDKDGNIKEFVDKMGDKMNYNVGYSGNQTGMSQTWMRAAGQNGIPTAFVIKNGEVEWIGHPMMLEEPLTQIKAGKFDEAGFKSQFAKEQAAEAKQQEAYAALGKANTLHKEGKKTEATALLERTVKANPNLSGQADTMYLEWLAKDAPHSFRKRIDAYANSKDESKIMAVCQFGLAQGEKSGDRKLGDIAFAAVLKGTKNADFLPLYYATLYYRKTNDLTKALACCKDSNALLPKSQFKDNEGLAADLKKTQEDLEKQANAKP